MWVHDTVIVHHGYHQGTCKGMAVHECNCWHGVAEVDSLAGEMQSIELVDVREGINEFETLITCTLVDNGMPGQ